MHNPRSIFQRLPCGVVHFYQGGDHRESLENPLYSLYSPRYCQFVLTGSLTTFSMITSLSAMTRCRTCQKLFRPVSGVQSTLPGALHEFQTQRNHRSPYLRAGLAGKGISPQKLPAEPRIKDHVFLSPSPDRSTSDGNQPL
jgi:hypothetical protein